MGVRNSWWFMCVYEASRTSEGRSLRVGYGVSGGSVGWVWGGGARCGLMVCDY